MSDESFSIVVDPDKQFRDFLARSAQKVGNFTIPFTLITKDWFKSNRAIFALAGPGKYDDLSEKYKDQKQKAVGFIYPILKRSGKLEQSLTNPGDSASIAQIINKTILILGTKDRTAVWHQGGTKKMPARPPVLLGAEQVSPPELNRRRDAWYKIIESYVEQVLAKEGAK